MPNFPIIFETEESGAISAYVAGLPVYAQGATQSKAERAIRKTLAVYLEAHPETKPTAAVKVANWSFAKKYRSEKAHSRVRIVGPAALMGSHKSARKAASSRANGRLGGRPAKRSSHA